MASDNHTVDEDFVDEYHKTLVAVGEENTYLPRSYKPFAESIQNFKVRNSDVIVASYPKTGTTWIQEMVWLIANDLDFKGAQVNIQQRFPFLEVAALHDFEKGCHKKMPDYISQSIEFLNQLDGPRFIKTHLPFCLLPDEIQNCSMTPKIVYITRNPKDTCVSHYHQVKLLRGLTTALEQFIKIFLAGRVLYGSYWKHVFGYWEKSHSPNLLFVKYEDMKNNLPSVIKTVADFFNKELSDNQIRKLTEHLSFESMKNNKAVNYEEMREQSLKRKLIEGEGFMRTGTVGRYKVEMSPDSVELFDKWIKKNTDGTEFGLQCNYHLQ